MPINPGEETLKSSGTHISSKKIVDGRRVSGAQMSEKLSNISSEDIEMRSAGTQITSELFSVKLF